MIFHQSNQLYILFSISNEVQSATSVGAFCFLRPKFTLSFRIDSWLTPSKHQYPSAKHPSSYEKKTGILQCFAAFYHLQILSLLIIYYKEESHI